MHHYTVSDVFTCTPLSGNPVAVVRDAEDLPGDRMQQIAREMNLSETTFVLPPTDRDAADARVRIFTPVNELPFAGHPLLGTAIVLGLGTDAEHLRLETAMGIVPFAFRRGAGPLSARMRQPIPEWRLYERADELLDALGVTSSTLPVVLYRNGPRHVFVGLPSIEDLERLHPDHRALSRHPDLAANCFAGDGTQWRMRMFSPAYGVVEDAATGSAAGPLALHLARQGLVPFGEDIRITQGVEIGRRSDMTARVVGAQDRIEAVEVAGTAVLTAHGRLLL